MMEGTRRIHCRVVLVAERDVLGRRLGHEAGRCSSQRDDDSSAQQAA